MAARSDSSQSEPCHLFVLLHGLWGHPQHMHVIRATLEKRARSQNARIRVLIPSSYGGSKSYDGVDVCADRVLEEIEDCVKEMQLKGQMVHRFSIGGYSLGGLVARRVIYELHLKGFFQSIKPTNFVTFASPAIGIPMLPGPLPSLARTFAAFFLSRTGAHLYLRDTTSTGRSLVEDLASPPYITALANFERIDIYANAINDRVVPFVTGGIEASDPFMPAHAEATKHPLDPPPPASHELRGLVLEFDEEYPPIITTVERETLHNSLENFHLAKRPGLGRRIKTEASFIKPWFKPSTYPFLPSPLQQALVVSIPLLLPPALIVVSAFLAQSCQSRWRVRQHMKHKRPQPEVDGERAQRQETGSLPIDAYQARAGARRESRSQLQIRMRTLPSSTLVAADSPSPMGEVSEHEPAQTTSPRTLNFDLAGIYPSTEMEPSSSPSATTDSAEQKSVLPPRQLELVQALNAIPHLRKHIVCFSDVFTSHQIIICQNGTEEELRMGLGVVKHWVDGVDM